MPNRARRVIRKRMRGSLAQEAYLLIRERILRGELQLGEQVSRRMLATELGISFSPVSEALQSLESEGLVETLPRVGTRIRVPTPQEVRGHCVVREALEVQAARLFAEKASATEKDELLKSATALDVLYDEFGHTNFDRDAWFDVHEQHLLFHVRLAECTGFQPLCDVIRRISVLIFNWMSNTGSEFRGLPSSTWHSELVEVLSRGEPGESESAMRRHVQHGEQEVLRRLALYNKANGAGM